MLTVVVLSLLYVGSANMYATADFEKDIKKIIKVKSREEQVLKEIASSQRTQEEMEAELGGKVVEFQSHYDDENITKEVLIEFFEDIKVLYTNYYRNGIKDRQAIASALTADEWNAIVKKYRGDYEKILKARTRRFHLLDKEMTKVRAAINESVDDPARNEEAMNYLDEAQKAFNAFYEASNQINFIENETLRTQSSSDEELKNVFNSWDTARAALYSDVIDQTSLLSDLYSLDEWEIIRNKLRSKFD